MESLKVNPYSQLIFDRGAQRKDSLFNKWCWENWRCMWKRMKPITKIKSKCIKDLNVRPSKYETIRRKHRGNASGHCNGLDPKAQETKANIDKWDYNKLKLLHSKGKKRQASLKKNL
jgi:hypothetical protein